MAPATERDGGQTDRFPLLTTKFHIARTRPNRVRRPLLNARLDEGLRCKLTIVSAPAGFGKTTLLAGWIAETKPSIAWVSLDINDNAPERFWAYLIGSLQGMQPGVGISGLDSLHSPHSPPLELVLTELINELASISGEIVLILDDFHTVTSPQVHASLSFFIERMPAQLHLYILSRVDPPLKLTRLRAAGELVEIRASDLRFSYDEAAGFLAGAIGRELPASRVAEIEVRTEGWIVGLQLAALSIQNEKPGEVESGSFGGLHRYVVEYFSDDVLQDVSPLTERFLLDTSVLDRLCGPLCDAVTGGENSAALLRQLEDANLFITPLDSQRRWYRYFALFAEVLRERLKAEHPERLVELHRRAGGWLEENGDIEHAVEHLLKGGEFEHAGRLVERRAESMLAHHNLELLLDWLRRLPDSHVRTRPRLALAFAWALLLAGKLESVDKYLEYSRHSGQLLPGEDLADLLGQVATVNSFLSRIRGDVNRAIELTHEAATGLSDDNQIYRGGALLSFGAGYANGTGDAAPVGNGTSAKGPFGALEALPLLARLQVRMGQLRTASATYQEALQLAEKKTGSESAWIPVAAIAYVGLGEIQYEWNDLDSSMRNLTEALKLTKRGIETTIIRDSYILLAKVHHARGDIDGALDAIMEAEQLLIRHHVPFGQITPLAAHRAALLIAQGRLDQVDRWAQECIVQQSGSHSADTDEFEQMILARYLLARNRVPEALEVLAPILQAAEAEGRIDSMIRSLLLQSLALSRANDEEQGFTAFIRALLLAEPEGYIRTIVVEGKPVRDLLLRVYDAQQRDEAEILASVSIRYIETLLDLFGARPLPPVVPQADAANDPARSAAGTLATPLSDREIEVLKLISDGKANATIADALYISVSTVKTHINNLYSKLGVESRTQALARARDMHLL
jgi:LuxR family maltose regulon positive regulatory protein